MVCCARSMPRPAPCSIRLIPRASLQRSTALKPTGAQLMAASIVAANGFVFVTSGYGMFARLRAMCCWRSNQKIVSRSGAACCATTDKKDVGNAGVVWNNHRPPLQFARTTSSSPSCTRRHCGVLPLAPIVHAPLATLPSNVAVTAIPPVRQVYMNSARKRVTIKRDRYKFCHVVAVS